MQLFITSWLTAYLQGCLPLFWMEFSVIPVRFQMERFIPVESFRKKGNTFQGISFFPLLLEFLKISVPVFHSYSARLFTVILPRKNAKDMKDGGRFSKRFISLQCVSLLVHSVGGRFRTQLQPCRWKQITFCGRYLCFSFTCMIRDSSMLPSELHRIKKCGCWFFLDEMWMMQQPKKKMSPSSQKNHNFLSCPIKRLTQQEVQPPCSLLT